ncbi:MAG: hypothetical protein ACYDFT_06945 [Thermoplasmata archaeon]
MVGYLGLSIGIGAIVVLIVVLFVMMRRLNQKTGPTGLVRHSRLTCPKCGRTFDFEWMPFGSVSAFRLGNGKRYMACPICTKWSTFDLLDAPLSDTAPKGPG